MPKILGGWTSSSDITSGLFSAVLTPEVQLCGGRAGSGNSRRLVPCLLVLLIAWPAAARQIVIKSFDAQVVVHRDSTIDVTEKIEAQFIGMGWHGLYRTIPVEYRDPAGLNYALFLDDVRATDDDGNSLKLEQGRQGYYLKFKIYVPEADNSTRTIVLHYRVLDAIRFFSDHDELYWNITGEQWDAPIQSASARIELPEGASGVKAVAYTGIFGSRAQDANVTTNDNVVQIYTLHSLGYHQGLTAVVGFDKGLVHEPTASDEVALFLRSNWPLFVIPLFAFLVMFWLWWTRGRDPERDAITVQYEPPDKLTPAECGALVDNEAAMRDITATLVDLAVKGYLTIEQKDQSGLLGLTHHRDYVFHLRKPPAEWDARAHERAMLSGLFFGDTMRSQSIPVPRGFTPQSSGVEDYSLKSGTVGSQETPQAVPATPDVQDYSEAFRGTSSLAQAPQASVALSELQNRFYRQLPDIRNCIFDALVQDGYYLHRPDTVRQGYIGAGLVIGFMIVAGGNWWAKQSGMSAATWTIAGFLAGAIICIFGWFMPARTITGARTFAKVLGFEDFLGRVESDRIKRLENAPELFEKFLPYAMALHVEKKWVQAFSGIAMQPPRWYQGPVYAGGFQPYFLVNDLNMMSSQVGTVMASSPRSSGGSGFGGGGGAGGGFGGGGGGGF
jgi:uncharacterized membrane protein